MIAFVISDNVFVVPTNQLSSFNNISVTPSVNGEAPEAPQGNDESNNKIAEKGATKGKFALWFEESYKEIQSKPRFVGILDYSAEEVHNGYFSQDRSGDWKDTRGDSLADDDTYELIMRDKERLLDSNTPLRFVFTHSALREGWDNPNVFQICTLNETTSEMKKRQEIGRGLRLPVNRNGERIRDDTINILTVVANESYENFAKRLQTETEEETGVEFGGRIKDKRKRKTLYDYIPVDSETVEKPFAIELDSREDVKFYFKLPSWFTIDTPLGNYNPDWAIVFEGDKRIYFVAETKGTNNIKDGSLTESEIQKILCGKKHFEIFEGVTYKAVKTVQDLLS